MKALMLPTALLLAALAGCVSRPPTIAHVHLGHAVTGVHVTPGKVGYFQHAERRAREAADTARTAAASADLEAIRTDVAATLVATESREQFGLKHSLVMASNHISFAATSPDASANLQQGAPVFARNIARLVERCELIALLGKDVAASASTSEATLLAGEISKLTEANLAGEDSDGDGKLGTTPAEFGVAQLRTQLDALVAREDPPYRTVDQWYLFNLVRLPNGRWVFDKLGRGGNVEGYQ